MFGQRNAFEDIFNFQREADRLFNQFWNELPARSSRPAPTNPFQVYTSDDNWRLEIPMPGIDPKQVSIDVAGNTISVRAEQNGGQNDGETRYEQTMTVAQFLEGHPAVAWVNYPGLPAGPYRALAQRYLPRGAGGILTFGIRGGLDAGRRFIEALQLFSHLANVGDAKSLVIHPASTTHQQLTTEEKLAGGITDDLIRLSVGLEEIDDILWDLDQALKAHDTDGYRAALEALGNGADRDIRIIEGVA